MKNILMVFALFAFTFAFAQETKNKNEKTTTTVTKTVVEDNQGKDVNTKKVTETESQKLALKNFDGKNNFDTTMTPTEVNSDVNYSNAGVDYRFQPQKVGYQLMSRNKNDNFSEYAILKPSSQKGYYILSQGGNNSFGYFNQNGNFVVESYDAENDIITTTVYQLQSQKKEMMNKNKI